MTTNDSGIQSNEFSNTWRRYFGASPPLGHVLRHEHFNAWTRFYALPDSKRYAENDKESRIILERANTLATECFGENAAIWIAAAYPSGSSLENNDFAIRMNMSKAMVWIDKTEEPEDQWEMSFFASRLEWKRNSLEGLFQKVSDDQERAILFSEVSQTVLAPYDGGFDIISFQPGKISRLESCYKAWMSGRSDRM